MRIPGSGSASASGLLCPATTRTPPPRAPHGARPGWPSTQTSKEQLDFQGQGPSPDWRSLWVRSGCRPCHEGTLPGGGHWDTPPWGHGMQAGDKEGELGRDMSQTTDLHQEEVPVLPSHLLSSTMDHPHPKGWGRSWDSVHSTTALNFRMGWEGP